MTPRTINVSYERVRNLGNYNSIRLAASVGGDLDDGEDAGEAMTAAMKLCIERVAVESNKIAEMARQRGEFAPVTAGN